MQSIKEFRYFLKKGLQIQKKTFKIVWVYLVIPELITEFLIMFCRNFFNALVRQIIGLEYTKIEGLGNSKKCPLM